MKALSYEISTISNEKNDEKCNKLNKRFEKIKKNIEGQKNKINIISKQVKRFSKDLYSENKKVMNQLCDIKNEINEEIMGNEQRKKDFRINFNYKIYNSFTYPVWLQESLKDKLQRIENSFIRYENKMNKLNDKVKQTINNYINGYIDITKVNSICCELNDIKGLTEQQKKLEKEILEKKDIDIKNAFQFYMKKEFNSKFDNLKNLLDKIKNINDIYEKNIQECQKLNIDINQKENEIKNKYCLIASEIKKKNENLNLLKNDKEKLINHINLLDKEKNKLNKLIKNFNELEQKKEEINYLDENLCNNELKNLETLIDEFEKELNNQNNNTNQNLIISEISFNIQNLNFASEFILKNSFCDIMNNDDPIYNKFREQEKIIVSKIFDDNRKKVENNILNNNQIHSMPNISNELVHQIIENEGSYNFFKNKIIREIESITYDDEKYKIEHLTILLVGRKEVGKTTLINYILYLENNKENNDKNNNINNNDFKEYTSSKIKYLKLIEAKGIGYDKDASPEIIKEKIKAHIGKAINSNAQNYNNVINCI